MVCSFYPSKGSVFHKSRITQDSSYLWLQCSGMAIPNNRLYTPTFWLLCLSYAFFGGSFNMILPELPSYLSEMGGEEYKGLIIALFTLMAATCRPFSGKLSDKVGRKPVIIFGTIVCLICSFFYPILTSIGGFLLLRLVHGLSTGFSPTGMTAYVADIVPVTRRGEAMGIIGVSMNLGSSVTPPIGSFLATSYSTDIMFYGSALLAMVSGILVIGIKESLNTPEKFSFHQLVLNKGEIIAPNALYPALVCGLSYFGFGVIVTITPDMCEHLGMTNKGLFFTSFTICSVLSRLVAGKISDIYGRIPVMRIAVLLLAISYVFMGYANTPVLLLMASGFVGFSLGIAIPAVFAWTVDRSGDHERGRSLATIFIGLELAIGAGALIGAEIYANNIDQYAWAFVFTSVLTLTALLFVKEGRNYRLLRRA